MSQTLVGVGIAVNFGFVSTANDFGLTDAASILKGWMLQNVGVGGKSEMESVRYLQGDVASENYYDYKNEASLMFVISAAGLAAARTASSGTPFKPGTFISITACASQPDMVATNWIVTEAGPEITGDVTKSAEIKLPLRRRAGITAAQSA